jgi:hypothetical protein
LIELDGIACVDKVDFWTRAAPAVPGVLVAVSSHHAGSNLRATMRVQASISASIKAFIGLLPTNNLAFRPGNTTPNRIFAFSVDSGPNPLSGRTSRCVVENDLRVAAPLIVL